MTVELMEMILKLLLTKHIQQKVVEEAVQQTLKTERTVVLVVVAQTEVVLADLEIQFNHLIHQAKPIQSKHLEMMADILLMVGTAAVVAERDSKVKMRQAAQQATEEMEYKSICLVIVITGVAVVAVVDFRGTD
jgi:hypothetical protein